MTTDSPPPTFWARMGFLTDYQWENARARWFDFDVTQDEFTAIEQALDRDGDTLFDMGYTSEEILLVKNDIEGALRPQDIVKSLPRIEDERLMVLSWDKDTPVGPLAHLVAGAALLCPSAPESQRADGLDESVLLNFKVSSPNFKPTNGFATNKTWSFSFPVLTSDPANLVRWGQVLEEILGTARKPTHRMNTWLPVKIEVLPFDPMPTAHQGVGAALKWLKRQRRPSDPAIVLPHLEALMGTLCRIRPPINVPAAVPVMAPSPRPRRRL